MRVDKIVKLEELKASLLDCLSQITDTAMCDDEDSMTKIIKAVEDIEYNLREAKSVVAEIRKL